MGIMNWIDRNALPLTSAVSRRATDVVYVEEGQSCEITFVGKESAWEKINGPAIVIADVRRESWTDDSCIHLRVNVCRQIIDGAPMSSLEACLRHTPPKYRPLNEGIRRYLKERLYLFPQLPHDVRELEKAPAGAVYYSPCRGGFTPVLPPEWVSVDPHTMSGVSRAVMRRSDKRVAHL